MSHREYKVQLTSPLRPGHYRRQIPLCGERDVNIQHCLRVIDGPKSGKTGREKKYASEMVTDDVGVVSYLAESGYTITMVSNFGNHHMTGFASNAKEWMPIKGTFEVVG